MTLRVMIVDDEPLAREGLCLRLQQMDDIEIVSECSGGNQAIQELSNQHVDLVFLDIKMPKVSGFDVIEAVGVEAMPAVVFLTAYDQFAIDAFAVNAVDYLLKPVNQQRLEAAVERVRQLLDNQHLAQQGEQLRQLLQQVTRPEQPQRIVIRNHGQIQFISAHEIIWVEADGDYVNIHTNERSHLLRETLANIEKRLAQHGFQRVHRSALVCLKQVEKLLCNDNGDYTAQLRNQTQVKVSRSYKDKLLASLS